MIRRHHSKPDTRLDPTRLPLTEVSRGQLHVTNNLRTGVSSKEDDLRERLSNAHSRNDGGRRAGTAGCAVRNVRPYLAHPRCGWPPVTSTATRPVPSRHR